MAEYKPKSSEESSTEEKIFEKGWLEITKKEFLYGCIGLPFFLAIISAIIVPAFTPPDIEDYQSTEKLEQVIKGEEG